MAKKDDLKAILAPVVEAMGYQFWGLEYLVQGRHTLLRVFIDKPEQGVNVDDCAAVSHQISGVLDVEDPISSVYDLEVSSPGLDRILFVESQYLQFVGSEVDLRLAVPFEGRRKFKGLLIGIEQDAVLIRQDNNEFLLPLEQIERARIVPSFDDKN